MEKKDLAGYLEFASRVIEYDIKANIADLIRAADDSEIHTFGWPIGPVLLNNEEYRPKPYSQNGIRAVIDSDCFDYWTLDKNGTYYILMSLFEDRRSENKIFIDTRTIRTTELLLRTAQLYRELGVPDSINIEMFIEYGGLKGRRLTAANEMRAFTISYERVCSLDAIKASFCEPLENFFNMEKLQEMVFEVLKNITEMCDGFIPDKKAFSDPIVAAYVNGRII